MMTARNRYETALQVLLGRGADTEIYHDVGIMAVCFAVKRGHVGTVRALLKAGANVEIKDAYEATPLSTAIYQDDKEIGSLIQEYMKE